MAEVVERKPGLKSRIKATLHGRKDGQNIATTVSEVPPDSPTTAPVKTPRRPSMNTARPPRPGTMPSEATALEESRQEREALERAMSSENVNKTESKATTPTPPPSDPIIKTLDPGSRAPTNGLASQLSPIALPTLLSIGLSSITHDAKTIIDSTLSPSDGLHITHPERSQDIEIQSLQRRVAELIAGQRQLEQERDTQKESVTNLLKWYTQAQELEKANETLQQNLFLANKKINENQPFIVAANTAQTENGHLQEKVKSLQLSYDLIFDDATRLAQERNVLEQNLQKSRETFQAVNKELLQLKDELRSNVDDDAFIRQWTNITAKIQNVSNTYFRGRLSKPKSSVIKQLADNPSSKRRPVPLPKRLPDINLTHDHAQYLNSETFRPYIIQAFIWWTLNEKVFDHVNRNSKALYWAGGVGLRSALSSLKSELRPNTPKDWSCEDPNELKRLEAEAKLYHKWRAMTSLLLLTKKSTGDRLDNREVTSLSDEVMEYISPYITKDDIARVDVERNVGAALDDIIATAVTLDSDMQQQCAWIYCDMWCDFEAHGQPLWGFAYNRETMDGIYGPTQPKRGRKEFASPCVEMVIQPALFREGNQFGEEYGVRRTLCKAKVVVGEHTPPRKR